MLIIYIHRVPSSLIVWHSKFDTKTTSVSIRPHKPSIFGKQSKLNWKIQGNIHKMRGDCRMIISIMNSLGRAGGGSKSCTICPNEANPQWTNYNAIVKWAEHCFFAKQTQISIIELLLWLDWAGTGRTFLGQCLRGVHLISAWQWTPQHTQHTDAVCSTRMLLLISGWSPMSLWSDDLCKDLRLFTVCLSKRDNRFIRRLHSEIDLHSNLD